MNKGKFWSTFIIVIDVILLLAVIAVHFLGATGTSSAALDERGVGSRNNVLILGTDGSEQLCDVIMLASFGADGSVHLLSVPRDTKVTIGGANQKINASYAVGGEDLVIEKVKGVTGIPIHGFVRVNFAAVESVVNALGGVQFYVPQNMDYEDPVQDLYIHLQEGEQVLNGSEALQLLRFRRYPMGDITRTQVQRDFLKAAVDQKANFWNILKIPRVYAAVRGNMNTTLGVGDAIRLAQQLSRAGDNVQTFEMPYTLSDPYVVVQADEMARIADAYFK